MNAACQFPGNFLISRDDAIAGLFSQQDPAEYDTPEEW
jgi:hypothetical protein